MEVCVHSPGICIKQAREFMKGLKYGCIQAKRYSIDKQPRNEGALDKVVDPYKSKTVDDHNNGIFKGFVYTGSISQPSQRLSDNPYYIEIQGDSINLFLNPNNPDKLAHTFSSPFHAFFALIKMPSDFLHASAQILLSEKRLSPSLKLFSLNKEIFDKGLDKHSIS
jgi:hypothetical protein